MKKYKVRVYNFIESFYDEYTVFATTKIEAEFAALARIYIETDYDPEDFEVLEIEEVE